MMGERVGRAEMSLDIQTGGGEVLAGIPQRAAKAMAATESWPPNIERAQKNLRGQACRRGRRRGPAAVAVRRPHF